MTHITISDRIIAVEVPKDIKNPEVVQNIYYKEWWFISDNVEGFKLPPDKTYKFLCLASDDYVTCDKILAEEWVAISKLDKDKEYALIEVQ